MDQVGASKLNFLGEAKIYKLRGVRNVDADIAPVWLRVLEKIFPKHLLVYKTAASVLIMHYKHVFGKTVIVYLDYEEFPVYSMMEGNEILH